MKRSPLAGVFVMGKTSMLGQLGLTSNDADKVHYRSNHSDLGCCLDSGPAVFSVVNAGWVDPSGVTPSKFYFTEASSISQKHYNTSTLENLGLVVAHLSCLDATVSFLQNIAKEHPSKRSPHSQKHAVVLMSARNKSKTSSSPSCTK